MMTLTITHDSETLKQIATIRNGDHTIRVREYVDGPATCTIVPVNPRHVCIPFTTPRPMLFTDAVSWIMGTYLPNVR